MQKNGIYFVARSTCVKQSVNICLKVLLARISPIIRTSSKRTWPKLFKSRTSQYDAMTARIRIGHTLYWQVGAVCNVEETKCKLCTEECKWILVYYFTKWHVIHIFRLPNMSTWYFISSVLEDILVLYPKFGTKCDQIKLTIPLNAQAVWWTGSW